VSGVLALVAEAWASLPEPVVVAVVPAQRSRRAEDEVADELRKEPRTTTP
jgi:hypothetical protein